MGSFFCHLYNYYWKTMFSYKKLVQLKFIFIFVFFYNVALAEKHKVNEILELIQKDLKILEKAVYSGSSNIGN